MNTPNKSQRRFDRTKFIGRKYGRLTIVNISEPGYTYHRTVDAKCDCGVLVSAYWTHVKRGNTKSCGCLVKDLPPSRLIHGHGSSRNGKSTTREFRSWTAMLDRCRNPNNGSYYRYGQRGITVCDRWKDSFENFYTDMGPMPSNKHSIDRINVDGDYEPGNCRWATPKQQANNTSRNRWLEAFGERKTISEWSDAVGIKSGTLILRLRRGMTPEAAVSTPVRRPDGTTYGGRAV